MNVPLIVTNDGLRLITTRIREILFLVRIFLNSNPSRDVGDGWAGWAIAHPGFSRPVNPISTRGGQIVPPIVLLVHPALGSFLRPCLKIE